MKLKFFFQLFLCALSFATLAQVSLVPLSQYSVGYKKDGFQLRTTSTTPTKIDTLKLPFIEDFSGSFIPLQKITVQLFGNGPTQVYQLTYIKRHGLKTGDSIHIFNSGTYQTAKSHLNGVRFVQVIDDYTFQLFNDQALSTPTEVNTQNKMFSCNWTKIGRPLYSHVPDSMSFLNNNGGVYINNDMSTNPINIGVASFDGVNYKGVPYSTSPISGYSDSLTSLPFNLSSNQPIDSIYFSFYWESKSLGDDPIATEFLSLEFKDVNQKWIQVWQQFGGVDTTDTFNRVSIPIKDISYLHKSFQYQFRSYGVLNGRFNVWNVDYIYIDTNRTYNDDSLKDIMIVKTNPDCLKNYTSIPYKHIKDLAASAISSETDSAFMFAKNFTYDPLVARGVDNYHLIRDNLSKDSISYDLKSFTAKGSNYRQSFSDTIPVKRMTAPYVLKEEFLVTPALADTSNRFDLSFNNFAAIETLFYDYYAYDDNIPESTLYTLNPGGIKVGQAMTILKTDTLTHIDYCFIRNNGPDLSNTQIFMNVWKQNESISQGTKLNPTNNRIDAVLVNQLIDIQYGAEMNGFFRYAISNPTVLTAGETYLFGFTQNAFSPLSTGYDRNNDHFKDIHVSLNNVEWVPLSATNIQPGSLMIRPVFSKNEVLTSTTSKQSKEIDFTIFPNPAQSVLHFTGEPEYIYVYDISGLLVFEKNVRDLQSLSTETLSSGLYIVVLSKGDYKEAKRLIIQK
jgi:archaellin